MMKKALLGLATLLVATLVLPTPAAAKGKDGEKAAEKESEKETQSRKSMERFATTAEKNVMRKEMKYLRSSFPANRKVIIETAQNGSRRTRAFAISVLGQKGEEATDLPAVLSGLKDSHHKVRLAAIMAIRKLDKDGEPSLEAVMHLIKRELDENVLKMAIRTVRDWADTSCLAEIVEVARVNEDGGVRNFAAQALKFRTKKNFGQDWDRWAEFLEMKLQQEEAEKILKHREETK